MPGDAPSAVPRAWSRRFVTQQGPQFARTEGLFPFVRGDARLLPLTIAWDAIGEFFSSLSMVPSRGNLLAKSA